MNLKTMLLVMALTTVGFQYAEAAQWFNGNAELGHFSQVNCATSITCTVVSGRLQIDASGSFDEDVTITGTTPSLTIGDGDEEDAQVNIDGNVADFSYGVDDTTDLFVLSLGTVLGTTNVFSADGTTITFTDNVVSSGTTISTGLLTASAAITVTTGNATVTAGDVILTAGRTQGGVSSTLTCSSGLVIDLSATLETALVTQGQTTTACAISFTNGTAGEIVNLTHTYDGSGVVTFADVFSWDAAWTPVVAECTGTDAAVTAASGDAFAISGFMTSATELAITGCQYFDAA